MTKGYAELLRSPQVGLNRSHLNPEERAKVRQMSISSTSGLSPTNSSGRFTSVTYLQDDLKAAAAKFVTENKEQLENIDFSKSNIIRTSLTREEYDWILHWLGERQLRVLNRVVRESRDEVDWVIARDKYHSVPTRRYSTSSESGSVKIDGETPTDIFEELPARATVEDLPDSVLGDREWLFVYYKEHPEFNCIVRYIDDDAGLWKFPECFDQSEE
jgi:hypothetical protein